MRPKSPFSKETYQRNAKIYRILANPKRLEILNTIKHQEAAVGELADVLKTRKSNVSQHLSILRHAGLVETRRDGQTIYYRIIDSRLIDACAILKKLYELKRIR